MLMNKERFKKAVQQLLYTQPEGLMVYLNQWRRREEAQEAVSGIDLAFVHFGKLQVPDSSDEDLIVTLHAEALKELSPGARDVYGFALKELIRLHEEGEDLKAFHTEVEEKILAPRRAYLERISK